MCKLFAKLQEFVIEGQNDGHSFENFEKKGFYSWGEGGPIQIMGRLRTFSTPVVK